MGDLSLKEISDQFAAEVTEATRRVVCVGSGKARPRSGLVIGEGEVLSIAQVAETGEKVPVHSANDEFIATVTAFDPSSGLVLLAVENLPGPTVEGSALPALGSLNITVSSPLPGHHEARLGMTRCVGGRTRLPGGRRIESYIQTDSARFRGFAGAAVFSVTGEVIGMTMPAHRREEGFVIPAGELLGIAQLLREGEEIGTAYLGVQATPVELPTKADDYSSGLLITGVESGSPAEQAGLQVGTFVVKVGETLTTDLESLFDSLSGVREGAPLQVVLMKSEGSIEQVTVNARLRGR